jgi:ferric-dicitrate binding protein FerR (iron transport regulator)
MSSRDGSRSEASELQGEDALRELFARAEPRLVPPAGDEAEIRRAVYAEWDALTGRRVVRRRIASVAAAAAVIASVVLLVVNTSTVPGPTIAFAERVQGDVQVDGVRIAVGAPISEGAEIATHSGQIALRLADSGGSLRLAPRTELTMSGSAAARLDAGSVYFDSEDGSAAGHFQIRTPFGIVRDVGTQFIAKLEGEHLEVGVRDGRVAIARESETVEAMPGERLTVPRGMAGVRRAPIESFGADWSWAERLAPPFDIDGRRLIDFLTWVAEQTGRALEFADPATEQIARDTLLSGSIDLEPLPKLAAVLALTDLDYRIDGDRIVITTK